MSNIEVKDFCDRYFLTLRNSLLDIRHSIFVVIQPVTFRGISNIKQAKFVSNLLLLNIRKTFSIYWIHYPSAFPTLIKNKGFSSIIKPIKSGSGFLQGILMERNHISKVLAQTRWKIEGKNGAAEILKLNPSTLRSRIRKLGIEKSL